MFLIISLQTQATAKEQPKHQYFGLGATVHEVEPTVYLVKTEGKKQGEGFVFTPKLDSTKEKITFQLSLKGKGTVIYRIAETDARGRFIKEEEMAIELTNEWNTYEIPFILTSPSSQIDVLVVTKERSTIEFLFKNSK